MVSTALKVFGDSTSSNPKMHQERKPIEIEMYCGSKYNKAAGTWYLTLGVPDYFDQF